MVEFLSSIDYCRRSLRWVAIDEEDETFPKGSASTVMSLFSPKVSADRCEPFQPEGPAITVVSLFSLEARLSRRLIGTEIRAFSGTPCYLPGRWMRQRVTELSEIRWILPSIKYLRPLREELRNCIKIILWTLEAANEIIINVDATPLQASTGEKRKREGRLRSRAWLHFTKLEKRPGEREECQCNHCGQFYVCSNKSGTTHLNRHIFDGGCPKYKPTLDETQKQVDYGNDGLEEDAKFAPRRFTRGNDRRYQEKAEQEITQLKEENARLQQEKDELASQKSNLEQLVISMATETACLVEENNKLKATSAKLQEEKQKTVTREEFKRLEDRVAKLREDFDRDRRGFPAAALAAITQLQKNK